jgi:hypothetical protein
MNSIAALALRLRSKIKLEGYLLKEALLVGQRSPEGMDILFSHHVGWEARIAESFRGTPHRVRFGDLQHEDLDAFDLVVPLSVPDVLHVGACDPVRSTALLPMPSAASVRLCDDKLALNRRLIELGFGDHVPALLDAPAPPFILKRRIAENSDDCHLVLDDATRQRLAPLIASDEFFCQQIAGGCSEYATHLVFRDGRIVTELSIEYIARHDTFIKATEPFVTDDLTHSPCPALITRMLSAIGFEGLCCLNYKIDRDGRMQLIEINPRFGGSLAPLFFGFVRKLHRAEVRRLTPSPATGSPARTLTAGR